MRISRKDLRTRFSCHAGAVGRTAVLRCLVLALGALTAMPATAWASQRQAAAKVREGIQRLAAGDVKGAADAFAEADLARPENPWIAFDRAVAYAAQGDVDKARELLHKAALSRDSRLAARAHYNLGCLAATQARAIFGQNPQTASAEVRERGLAALAQAVGHYRDCLRVDPDHADARYNLELIRLWIKHMQAAWEEHDRQKQRNETNLPEFLELLESRQRVLRGASRALASEPDSPRRRQALVTSATGQRALAEEIGPLKQKIREHVEKSAPTAQASPAQKQPPPLDAEQKLAVDNLCRLADEAGSAMHAAASRLHEGAPAEAIGPQTQAVEKLDQILTAILPFANLLQKSIARQQGLIDQVTPAVRPQPANADKLGASKVEPVTPSATSQPAGKGAAEQADWPEAGWEQGFLPGWSEALAGQAQYGLKHWDSLSAAGATQKPSQPSGPTGPETQSLKHQQEALKRSMQKAVELCPTIRSLTSEAAQSLKAHKPGEALPKQDHALKLLRQIADELPKEKPQQNQQGQGKQQDQQPKDQPAQQDRGAQAKVQPREPKDLSQQQAEATLRRARERQRKRQEMEKQLREAIYRPEPVEKDW